MADTMKACGIADSVAPLPNMCAIVAVCDDWGIGRDGRLLVRNKADMRIFKHMTEGNTVIMGRRTLESLPGGKPLANRRNIVLTREAALDGADGIEVAHCVSDLFGMLSPSETAYVIGGGAVYRELLPLCSCAIVTRNHCVRDADTFFPNLDANGEWEGVRQMSGAILSGRDVGVRYDVVAYHRVESLHDDAAMAA